jgi:flagellar protein FliO/FliZ
MKRSAPIVLPGLGTLALAVAARAADADQVIFPGRGAGSSAPVEPGLSPVLWLLGAALAAVGGWLLWRGRRTAARVPDGRRLAIEETRPLGNRQYLVVASYEGRKFLLGVCPGRIDHLAALSEESPRP